jgi:membrane protease YdiL (CAAX protease family)
VVNNSTSTSTPSWPTRWPKGSFRFWPTALLTLIVVGPIVFMGASQMVAPQQAPSATLLGNPLVVIFVLASTAVIEGLLVLVLLPLMHWVSGFSLHELGYRALRLSDVGTAAAGSIVMAIVGDGGESLIDSLTKSKHNQISVEMLKHLHDGPILVTFALFAIVLAPFFEESIFRAFLFNAGLRHRGFWFGAIVSGLAFGIAHGDRYAMIPLALGGIVLAYVYYRTRNIYASMITHGLFNAFSVIALIFAPTLAK